MYKTEGEMNVCFFSLKKQILILNQFYTIRRKHKLFKPFIINKIHLCKYAFYKIVN